VAAYPGAVPVIPNTGWDHNQVAAEVMAIAAELGTNPSAGYTTLVERLSALSIGGRTDVYPEDHGYSSVGTAAQKQTAMQAFMDALVDGKTGVLRNLGYPYEHNNVLYAKNTIPNARLVIHHGAELRSTVQTASAFRIQAHGFTLEGPGKVVGANVSSRGNTLNHQKIVIDPGVEGVTITGITVDGSHGTGFFSYGGINYKVGDLTVKNTQADGIHNTNLSSGGRFTTTTSIDVGDDGFAVVSYNVDGGLCTDIRSVNHTTIRGGARGVAVVGGKDIQIVTPQVLVCDAAGIYIAAESSFNSYGCEEVRVLNPFVHSPNIAATDHGAAMFYSSVTGRGLLDCSIDGLIADRVVRDDAVAISGWLRFVQAGTPGTSARLGMASPTMRGDGPTSQVQGNMATTIYKVTNPIRQAW
jgi:hypothetical protein